MLVKSEIANRMFGQKEVLVAAKHLLGLEGIAIDMDVVDVEYLHIICHGHQIITANGAKTETLYLGQQAEIALGEEALEEISCLLPDLMQNPIEKIRPFVAGRKGRKLTQRHLKNKRDLVQD
jgi:hypothetical protein